jgi:hypothetical protein
LSQESVASAQQNGQALLDVRFAHAVDARGSIMVLSACEKNVASKVGLLDELEKTLIGKGWSVVRVNLPSVSPSILQSVHSQTANLGRVFLLAHGCDAGVASRLLKYLPARGFVLLAGEKNAQVLSELAVQLPILVIDAENDDNQAVRNALSNSGIEMAELPGANHYFLAQVENLGSYIANWLKGQ